jgi:hypothetical protein
MATDTWYEVTLAAENFPVHRIRAAYISVDERLYPGWTLLKDEAQTIRAMVRSDMTFLIKRCDDPPRPSPAAVATAMGISTSTVTMTGTAAPVTLP